MNSEEVIQCSICGKEFNIWDKQQDFKIDVKGMYGSAHDGEHIKCRFCCDCLDKLLDEYILPKCHHDPVQSYDW